MLFQEFLHCRRNLIGGILKPLISTSSRLRTNSFSEPFAKLKLDRVYPRSVMTVLDILVSPIDVDTACCLALTLATHTRAVVLHEEATREIPLAPPVWTPPLLGRTSTHLGSNW